MAAEGTLLDEVSRALEAGELDEQYARKPSCLSRCSRVLPRRLLNLVLTFLTLLLLLVLGVLALFLFLISFCVQKALSKAVFLARDMLARDLYMLRCVRPLHVNCLSRLLTCCGATYWHSRFVDVRAVIPLDDQENCAVHLIPQLEDNVCYLVVELATCKACLVDPSDAPAVLRAGAWKAGYWWIYCTGGLWFYL